MMQEQQKLKEKPEDEEDDGKSYKGFSKASIALLVVMSGSMAYIVNRA